MSQRTSAKDHWSKRGKKRKDFTMKEVNDLITSLIAGTKQRQEMGELLRIMDALASAIMGIGGDEKALNSCYWHMQRLAVALGDDQAPLKEKLTDILSGTLRLAAGRVSAEQSQVLRAARKSRLIRAVLTSLSTQGSTLTGLVSALGEPTELIECVLLMGEEIGFIIKESNPGKNGSRPIYYFNIGFTRDLTQP